MSPDAERRLILIACSCAFVAALCAVSVFVAWWAGPVAFVVGIAVAFAVTLEQQLPPPPVVKPDPEGLSSREIARRAERAGAQ